MSHLVYARGISLISNGLYAGIGLCINTVNVPSIKASNDPLPAFTSTYERGHKVALTNIALSSAAHFYIYYKTRNQRALWCGLLSVVSVPYTLLLLKPINDQLFALAHTRSTDFKQILELINSWGQRQWFRTIVGNLAFVLNVFYY
ncbi:hypothetical protein BC941DRAFT_434520 [Chlamydoabsidia padenii]|nr:hypothetical protein BC941DRAFT_434520 [Chlamydoabsidia padenii]